MVSSHGLVALGNVGGVGDFDLFQCRLLGGIVGGADLIRAFEGHVLEHVGQAGLIHGILRGTRIDHGEEGEDWRLGPFADDDGQAVRQLLNRDALFKGRDILSSGERCEDKN